MSVQELAAAKKREQIRSVLESRTVSELMTREFEHVSPDEQLSDVLNKMGQLDLHEIPVSPDGKKLAGVVSYGTLLKRRNLSVTTKASTIAIMPQEITPEMPVTEAAEAILTSGHRQMPVVKGGAIQGTISRTDLIRLVEGIRELKELKVEYVMTDDVQSVSPDESVEKALMTMKNLSIRTLPVIDADGALTGIVGIKQVADYNWKEKKRATLGEMSGNSLGSEVKVSSVALATVYSTTPEADLGTAVKEMLDKKVSSLPVLDGGDVVGILTKYDVIELLASFRQRDMVYTQITGLDPEDRGDLEPAEREITTSLQKIAKISRPMLFTVHVTKYKAQGGNVKYSLNGRLITENRVWVASAVDWDMVKAIQSLMSHFERRVIEKKEEKLSQRKKSRPVGHS